MSDFGPFFLFDVLFGASAAAVGVGICPPGDDEEPVPEVRGTDGRSRQHVPYRIIPAGVNVTEHSCDTLLLVHFHFPDFSSLNSLYFAVLNCWQRLGMEPAKQSWHVLHHDVAGSNLANDSLEFSPKARASVENKSMPLASKADALAGESSEQNVNRGASRPVQRADVVVDGLSWPLPGEHGAAEGVALAEPFRAESLPLEAEVEAAEMPEKSEPIVIGFSSSGIWHHLHFG